MNNVTFRTRLALLFAVAATGSLAHATPNITSVVEAGGDAGEISARYTGQTYVNTGGLGTVTVGLFGEDVHAFTDRPSEWNSVLNNSSVAIGMPSYLVNGEYIVPGVERRATRPTRSPSRSPSLPLSTCSSTIAAVPTTTWRRTRPISELV